MNAGVTTCPSSLRAGFQRMTPGPGETGPVRSLGPARSKTILQDLPVLFGEAQILHHATPLLGTVVSAVYAHDIHSAARKIADHHRIAGGFARQGDHNADSAIVRRLAQRFISVSFRQTRALLKIAKGFFDRALDFEHVLR
jgi:hypothetical protein